MRRTQHATTMRPALLAASALALWVASPLALCSPAAAEVLAPLPAADYAVRSVCAAPTPGHAGCLALRLVPQTAAARARTHPLGMTRSRPIASASAAEGVDGLRPQDLRSAYFPGEQPDAPASEPQTIALVDAYDDPNATTDLNAYSKEFGLPELPKCTAGAVSDCFEKVNQLGETTSLPSAEGGWALETSTDIEVARAICQNCRILLVEANSSSYEDLERAEDTAVELGATEISNSWGGEEPLADRPAFEHPKTVITASAGDAGYLNWTEKGGPGYFAGADYPASSPHVVAVGGTRLTLSGGARQSETVWNDGEANGAAGGGCSEQFTAPPWQQGAAGWTAVGCGSKRAVADVSADADPYTGVAVYDSFPYPYEEAGQKGTIVLGWVPIGGTSVASPIVASVFALAGGAHGVAYPAQTLYSHLGSPALYDVAEGGNGKCDNLYTGSCSGSMLSSLDCGQGLLICNAGPGYDGPTGVGVPNGIAAFELESEAEHAKKLEEEQHAAEEKQKAEEAKLALEEAKSAEARKAEEERLAAERIRKEEEARGSPGGKSGGEGGGQGAGAGSGAGAGTPIAGVSGTSPSGSGGGAGGRSSGLSSHTSAGIGGRAASAVRLYHLALTARASAVIARRLPTLSQVAFAFTLTARAHVRATLFRRTLLRGRTHWASAAGTLTLSAAGGRNRAHLRGSHPLAPGRYRLTLAPAHGARRSIVFVVR
ncbi:MAG: S8 family serine peptidase [Solirubrobacterales bacterium]